MMGMGQMSDNDISSAMEMFDMSRFEPPAPAPQQPQVSPQGPQGYNANPYMNPMARVNRYGRGF